VEGFLTYKQALIDYLERFIGELVVATHEVAERLAAIEKLGSSGTLAGLGSAAGLSVNPGANLKLRSCAVGPGPRRQRYGALIVIASRSQ